MISLSNIPYAGSTPGADANTYTLFDTTRLPQRNWGPMNGVHTFHWDIKHSQAGTVRGYRSQDGGTTWVQFYDTGSMAAPAYTSNDSVTVEGFRDFKFEWVNGGAAQAAWSVSMDCTVLV